MNEFVEVVLGGSILIPIATAYLGLEAVQAATAGGSGFSLGFLTLPTLFEKWGWFGPLAGAMWFGLLFFAGITSSLAMGQPIMAFFEDEFKVRRVSAALLFGGATFVLGVLCVWLYPGGAFDEFDFWSGTFALVLFALGEVFIFAWIFGMKKGWDEITRGADMQVPVAFRYIIQFVTPVFILVVFVGALIKPVGEWSAACTSLFAGDGWPWAPDSVVGRLLHVGDGGYAWTGADGTLTHAFVQDMSRAVLLAVLAGFAALVWIAWRRRARSTT